MIISIFFIQWRDFYFLLFYYVSIISIIIVLLHIQQQMHICSKCICNMSISIYFLFLFFVRERGMFYLKEFFLLVSFFLSFFLCVRREISVRAFTAVVSVQTSFQREKLREELRKPWSDNRQWTDILSHLSCQTDLPTRKPAAISPCSPRPVTHWSEAGLSWSVPGWESSWEN